MLVIVNYPRERISSEIPLFDPVSTCFSITDTQYQTILEKSFSDKSNRRYEIKTTIESEDNSENIVYLRKIQRIKHYIFLKIKYGVNKQEILMTFFCTTSQRDM